MLAWPSSDRFTSDDDKYWDQAQGGLRAAATAGITVAGILIPLSILTIGLTASDKLDLPSTVLVDFFVANVWLLISLLLGLCLVYFAGVRGYRENILRSRGAGAVFGLQLLFLAVGVVRLMWGMFGLVDTLI